jgi:hypothetical protein
LSVAGKQGTRIVARLKEEGRDSDVATRFSILLARSDEVY